MKNIIISLVKSLFILILLFIPSRFINVGGGAIYFVLVLLTAFPIALNALSRFSLYKEIKLIEYNGNSSLFKLLSGKFLGYSIIILFSITVSFILPVRLYLLSNMELILLLIVLPAYMLSSFFFKRFFGYIYNKNFAPYRIERWSYLTSAFISAAIYPILTYYLHEERSILLHSLEQNYIAFLIGHFLETFDNITATILNINVVASAPTAIFLSVLVLISGGGIIFYALINFVAFFYIKRENLYKTFYSIKKARSYNIYFASSVIVCIIFIFYPVAYNFINQLALKNSASIEGYLHIVRIEAEVINGQRYKAGTYANALKLKSSFDSSLKEDILASIDIIYDKMAANVDKYLDWYYSLESEYKRLIRLIAGNSTSFLKSNMRSILASDINSFDDRIAQKKEQALEEKIKELLEENRVDNMTLVYKIEDIYIDKNILKLDNSSLSTFRLRFRNKFGKSLEAESVAERVAEMAAASNGFKSSNEALIKIATSKAASVAAGTISAIIASTVVTPAGGIAVGAATGLAVDKALLSLEKLIKRDEYRKEIMNALEQDRQSIKQAIEEIL